MPDWKPIETAPRDYKIVDLWVTALNRTSRRFPNCMYDDGCWWQQLYDPARPVAGNPTHWMPRPEPPESKETPIKGLYRKRPLLVEAHQWFKNGDHPQDGTKQEGIASQEGKIVRRFRTSTSKRILPCTECGMPYCKHGWLGSSEGGHLVCPSDWITTGL